MLVGRGVFVGTAAAATGVFGDAGEYDTTGVAVSVGRGTGAGT